MSNASLCLPDIARLGRVSAKTFGVNVRVFTERFRDLRLRI